MAHDSQIAKETEIVTYIDSNKHDIIFSYDKTKTIWRDRYFGQFTHLDGTPACDGEFHLRTGE